MDIVVSAVLIGMFGLSFVCLMVGVCDPDCPGDSLLKRFVVFTLSLATVIIGVVGVR